jgi:xylulokinase
MQRNTPITCVVNLSLRSIRLILFESSGKKIYEDWLPVRTYIDGLTIEQDPEEWWRLLVELFQTLAKKREINGEIISVTVTSSALCLVGVDSVGNVVGRAVMVADTRSTKEADTIKGIMQTTGELVYHKVDASYLLPKVLWIKKHKKTAFLKVMKFLSANDFLIAKLSGIYVTDTFNAEKFYFDRNTLSYPRKLLRQIGISKTLLPAVVEPGFKVGKVRRKIIAELSILDKAEVYVSTYDAICALIGSCTHQEGELNNVCGTCSSYRVLTEDRTLSAPRLLEQEYLPERLRIIGGSNNLEGGVLEWAKECYYADVYPKDDAGLYALMEDEARGSNLGAGGILFIPYLIGERLPMPDAYVRGMFFGMERFHTRKDIIRSVFEATAFQAKMMVDEFEKSGIEISKINMSGGVAKLALAAQIRADVLGIPIHVLEEVETTALGAFIFVQKGSGKIASIRDGKTVVKIRKKFLPNMHNHNCYASLYMLYKELYAINSPLFRKRHDILQKVTHYQKKVLENL